MLIYCMGETQLYQPLTREDRITVVLYRIGIVLSSVIVTLIALMMHGATGYPDTSALTVKANTLLVALYVFVGVSVFFIHLYVGRFHRFLKRLYAFSVAVLVLLFVMGRGDASAIVLHRSFGPLCLLPLSACLGFITAKEAFCFRLIEGYLLALVMPIYLLLVSAGGMTPGGIFYGIALIAAMLLLFTARKVFMPIHYDIGDKSAYS